MNRDAGPGTDERALDVAVVSIASTQRRRFFWAAWWTAPPHEKPFQKPDASNGGARSEEEAKAEAVRVAGRHLAQIEPRWARAWMRTLRGEAPWTPYEEAHRNAPPKTVESSTKDKRASVWTILGIEPGATEDEIKRAYRRRALETHPDRGGDPAVFRAVQQAFERALRGDKKGRKARR